MDHAVAVEERDLDQSEEQHRPAFFRPGARSARKRHQRHDATLAVVVRAHHEEDVLDRDHQHQCPGDQRQHAVNPRRRHRGRPLKALPHRIKGRRADVAVDHAERGDGQVPLDRSRGVGARRGGVRGRCSRFAQLASFPAPRCIPLARAREIAQEKVDASSISNARGVGIGLCQARFIADAGGRNDGEDGLRSRDVRLFEHGGWERAASGPTPPAFSPMPAAPPIEVASLAASAARSGIRVLDLACGPGLVTGAATRRDAAATGYDFSIAILTRGARGPIPTSRFDQGDAEASPLRGWHVRRRRLEFRDAPFPAP